jgi:hypothetical protein
MHRPGKVPVRDCPGDELEAWHDGPLLCRDFVMDTITNLLVLWPIQRASANAVVIPQSLFFLRPKVAVFTNQRG